MSMLHIPRLELGVVRVFAVSRPMADMARALRQSGKSAIASELLGHDVTADDIELFALSDLTGVGLSRYLADGYDIDAEALRRDHGRLDALDGYVLLLFSAVAQAQAVTITPGPDLTLIGTYTEPKGNHAAAPVAVEAALPYTGVAADPKAAPRYRIGSAVSGLAVLALLILIWWIL